VKLEISDLNGRIIHTDEKYLDAGNHRWTIDATELGLNGLYYYRMQTARAQLSKLLIVK
jgi:hypothetical protein